MAKTQLLSRQILDTFKYEIADQIGLTHAINTRGWPEMNSRECGKVGGKIGGSMVRVLIRHAQEALGNDLSTID